MKERFLNYLCILVYIPLVVTLIDAVIKGRIQGIALCLLTAALYPTPVLLEKWLSIRIPPLIKYMMVLFSFLSLYLGGAANLFIHIAYWDKIIHFLSGFLWVTLFLSLMPLLSGNPHFLRQMKPGFTAWLILLSTAAMGSFWELIEFICDLVFTSGLQRNESLFRTNPLNGLTDTMTDLLAAFLGAAIMSRFYKDAMKKDQWLKLEKVIIRRSI